MKLIHRGGRFRTKGQLVNRDYIWTNYQISSTQRKGSMRRLERLKTKSPDTQVTSKKILIENRFLLRKLLAKRNAFNIYEGIDLHASKFVTVYVKPASIDFDFSKKIKEDLRTKISPSVAWTGPFKIQKTVYKIQIHEKYGPSLKAMFSYVRSAISERDFLLLMYQLIKLVEKFGSVGYVYRQLNMEHIVFDSSPEKNELYLFNVFPLRKRGEESQALDTRFCSRGAHLGLKSSVKDDLESICYILINIHTQGTFLRNISSEEYEAAKSNIDFNSFDVPLPSLFLDFYSYVRSLNHSDEVNFFKWRTLIYKSVGKDAFSKPYDWMMAKPGSEDYIDQDFSQKQIIQELDIIELEDEIKPEDQIHIDKLKRESIKNNSKR